jgi:hypothetical protein
MTVTAKTYIEEARDILESRCECKHDEKKEVGSCDICHAIRLLYRAQELTR